MDLEDQLRLGQRQQVVVAFEIELPVGEALATIICLGQLARLNHGAHAAIEHQDTLVQQLAELGVQVASFHG